MGGRDFTGERGERLERRDQGTRAQVLKNKRDIDQLGGAVEDLRGAVLRSKESIADHEGRLTRVEDELGLCDYECLYCGAVGSHYAFDCDRR